jgi:predicted MFS family arabinose efflux permease
MFRRLAWLSVGTLAVGTEAFMIAGTLPSIAADVGASLSNAGYLVTIYAGIYAIGSPILAAVTGAWARKPVLIGGMLIFALANAIAAAADGFWLLFAARALAGVAAALFVPAAYAVASAMVEPASRGRALAVVAGGLSVAIALGAPVSTWIALHSNWRVAFVAVGALALVAALGIGFGFAAPKKFPAVDLRTRLSPLTNPRVLLALTALLFWTMGSFCAFIFLAPLLEAVAHADADMISFALFVSGACGVAGTFVGGAVVDAWGPERSLVFNLVILGLSLTVFSVLAQLGHPESALLPAMIAVGVWGMSSWALNSAQQVRLLELAPASANLVLSLNSSAIYLGVTLGSALGALTLRVTSVTHLGWVAGGCEAIALSILILTYRWRGLSIARTSATSD